MANPTRRRVVTSLTNTVASALGWSALRRGQDAHGETFGAWLTGENQLPPVETDAFGFAVFQVRLDERSRVGPDEWRIDYWLVVSGIENAAESHVHKGPPDLDGNVVAYLFGPVEEPVSKTGVLAAGTLTDEDMLWPLTDVQGMVEQMREANVYVNVHTAEHPPGEIRGQIRPTGVLPGG